MTPRKWWERVDWPGACAFVMAASLSIGFAAGLVMSASPRTPPINETTATLLATLGGAMGGAVATFIGLRAHQHHDKKKEVDDGDDERVLEGPDRR